MEPTIDTIGAITGGLAVQQILTASFACEGRRTAWVGEISTVSNGNPDLARSNPADLIGRPSR